MLKFPMLKLCAFFFFNQSKKHCMLFLISMPKLCVKPLETPYLRQKILNGVFSMRNHQIMTGTDQKETTGRLQVIYIL